MTDNEFSKILQIRTRKYLKSFIGREINESLYAEMAKGLVRIKNELVVERKNEIVR